MEVQFDPTLDTSTELTCFVAIAIAGYRDVTSTGPRPLPSALFSGSCSIQGRAMAQLTIPVATRSKAWVCGRSLAGIVGSNPAGVMDVCLL
jgi:hypothetical protein